MIMGCDYELVTSPELPYLVVVSRGLAFPSVFSFLYFLFFLE